MALKEELERSGEVLFRWRSYPPALFFGVVVWGVGRQAAGNGRLMRSEWWGLLCLVPIIIGLAVRMWAIGTAAPHTSGGNRSGQRAENLNTTGAYSIVRHPLYLGVFLGWIGVAMFPASIGVALIVLLLFWIYYERIMIAEESFLERKFGATYTEWANRTPAIIPRVTSYVPPKYPFSLRRALQREYSAWLAAIVPLFVLKIYSDSLAHGRVTFNRMWVTGLVLICVVAAIVRFLKHRTRVLQKPHA